MFGDQASIIESNQTSQNTNNDFEDGSKKKKILLGVGLGIILLIIIVGVFFIVKNLLPKKVNLNNKPQIATTTIVATSTLNALPDLSLPNDASSTANNVKFSEIAIEYLSFANFYKTPDNNLETKFTDYELPLNIKIDVLNYYALSRKLNLDPGIDSLNNDGFTVIDNPWAKEAPDFYSIYSNLEKNQIPVLITSDFVFYYYQTILKKVFKDIEENIFYSNLWSINKDLYESAKNRYEARLASIGDINDSILEGERLETAFFAVSLELLKPTIGQTAAKDMPADTNKFSFSDANRYSFVTPPYLKDDVNKELKLIRETREKVKSPIMLYVRDYKDFIVPIDYRDNAKLNNFYLAKKWLNSNLPLNYKDKSCPNCLLDKEDWRLAMIAASFISVDFSDLPDLKNKWARIYKVMSYFDPLRADLNYVAYRDTLKATFGEAYKIEELFDDKNPEAKNNLAKFQTKLKAIELSSFLGAIDKNDINSNFKVGFKMLVESYSPNDYIFNRLVSPNVTNYMSTSTELGNISICDLKIRNQRCNGIALDVVNLVTPIKDNNYFEENTYYLNYLTEANNLKDKFKKDIAWQSTNYWSTLSAIGAYLNIDKNKLPIFSQSIAWQNKNLNTAASAWINLQLPLDKFRINELIKSTNFSNFSKYRDNSYVEPNLNLINELLANNEMMQQMLAALQVDREVPSAQESLRTVNANLKALQKIIIKELTGESLGPEDNEIISNFTKQLTIENGSILQKQMRIQFPNSKKTLKEDLSRLKLMVLIHQDGEDKVLSIGPVWNYIESR